MYHGYYYGFDTTYLLLVVPALLIALIAQIQVKSAFSRYARVRCTSGLTGALDSRATDELLRLFEEINRGGQTILMVTHSVKAASHASRVLFIKDGEVFHEIYRGESSDEQLYQKISDTLTMLATGGERHA